LLSPRLRFAGVVGAVAVATRLASIDSVLSVVVVGTLALAATAAGFCLHGREQGREWRRTWGILSAGLLMLVSGGLAGAVLRTTATSFPSTADFLGLVGQVLTVAGLLGLLRHRLPGRAFDSLFQAVTIALAAGFVVWALGVEVDAGTGSAVPLKVLALASPLVDLVALWLTARLMLLTDDHPVAYRYLGSAFLCQCVVHATIAGGVVGSLSPGGELNALALWSYCLWGAGALHPSLRQHFDPVPSRPATSLARGQSAFVLGALLVAPAVIALQAARGQSLHLLVVLPGLLLMPLLIAAQLLYKVRERTGAEYRTQHDPLTGLPNQVLFQDRVSVALTHRDRHGTAFAVMFLDLDRFKGVNDSLGHAVGNELLRAVANRLRRTLRAEDTVGRMGGDEFTVLVPGVTSERDFQIVAEKLLNAFREPFLVGNRDLVVTASIGIAVAPGDGDDVDALLKHADTAMYRAKAKGRNAYHFYTSDMSARAELRLALEGNLRLAIERAEMVLHYQTKVDVNDGIVGLEALVRWRHPRLGLVSPEAFIPLAEETGLIVPLGEWVLQAACRQLRQWIDAGLRPVPIAVNLSARQFEQQQVEDLVARVLDETGVPPGLLELELTESVFMHDIRASCTTIERLQAMGVRCSIDDFGTGFSGLKYLAELPIDSLKIDKSFVQRIGGREDKAPIIGAVIALAHSLQIKVVAEGVETEEQARFLRALGCEQMQGFLFSRPLPADEVERLIFPRHADKVAGLRPAGVRTPSPVPLTLTPAAATSLLSRLCTDDEVGQFEPAHVAALLTALQPEEVALPISQRMWRSASVKLATGTFAGLLPLSTGLAAAGALPAPAQRLASSVLDQVGVDVPSQEQNVSPYTPLTPK
jgi:diguanylate cyclase (GGDEF)-like protein